MFGLNLPTAVWGHGIALSWEPEPLSQEFSVRVGKAVLRGGFGCCSLWSVCAAAALPGAAVSSSASLKRFPEMENSLNLMAEPPSQDLMPPTAQTGSGQSVRELYFCTPQAALFVGLNDK